jgi:hypothetical protein
MRNGGTCSTVEGLIDAGRSRQQARYIQDHLITHMNDTLADDVLYLTALVGKDQTTVVPRLNGLIPDCGAWIRSRSYAEAGTARLVFEFPRDICVEIYSALVSVGLQLSASSHSLLTELCRCTPHIFNLPGRTPTPDVTTLDAATRYICSLEIIKVQLQIWMVREEELDPGGSHCCAA